MKFRFLRSFLIVFACVIGTGSVSVADNACVDPGYYLNIYSVGNNTYQMICEMCPAGYYCPGQTDDNATNQQAIPCPENTYSEGGAGSCSPCSPGYSTEFSGPAEGGYDGLCLGRSAGLGVKCVSSDACKLTKSGLSMARSDSWVLFYLDDNIKIEALNGSVVKTFQGQNPATTETGRPNDDFDDDE